MPAIRGELREICLQHGDATKNEIAINHARHARPADVLTNAKVVKHARVQRLVPMSGKGMSIDEHAAAGQHAACERDGRGIEEHDVDRVGAKLFRADTIDDEVHTVRVGSWHDTDRDVHVAAGRQRSGCRSPEQIDELHVFGGRGNWTPGTR